MATRALEGLAAAFVVPMTFAMLGSVFPPGAAWNRAFGIWGAVTAGAATLGLVIGGVLVTAAGWRWVFLVNLPLGATVIAAALRALPADPGAALRGFRPRSFDLGGALLNVSRQLGGALGLAVIATITAGVSARAAAAGHASPDALTSGFHAGFAVSTALVIAGLAAAAVLLREDGRGERLNLIELQAGG